MSAIWKHSKKVINVSFCVPNCGHFQTNWLNFCPQLGRHERNIDSILFYSLFSCLVVRLDGSKPIQYGMKLDVELTVDHIKKQLSILSSLSMEQIAFFDVTVPSCLRRYTAMDNNHAKIKQLNIRDFIAYELPLMKLTDGNHFPSTYIIAVHRRLERQERYLSPLTREKMIFFGHPIIIPYNNCSSLKITNQYIYENIFKQLERLLRKNTDMTLISNHALDCDDSLGERYPFILKHVNEDGKRCSICPWNR